MTHAWLFTGPPGSGRSVAARAFAAALQCPARRLRRVPRLPHRAAPAPTPTCASSCPRGCRSGSPRSRRSSASPAGRRRGPLAGGARRGRRPAHRGRVQRPAQGGRGAAAADGLPALRAVAHPDDVSVTIRSRCRVVPLRTPPAEAVAEVLVRRDGIDPALAAWAAAAAGGHVGRARRLARDEDARLARKAVLAVPAVAGRRWAPASTPPTSWSTRPRRRPTRRWPRLDAAETEALKASLGVGARGPGRGRGQPGRRAAQGAGEAAEVPGHPARRDALDRALVDLAGVLPGRAGARRGRRGPRRRWRTPTAAPTPRSWPAGSAPRARCAGSTRCWPAGRRSSRTSSRRSPSRR